PYTTLFRSHFHHAHGGKSHIYLFGLVFLHIRAELFENFHCARLFWRETFPQAKMREVTEICKCIMKLHIFDPNSQNFLSAGRQIGEEQLHNMKMFRYYQHIERCHGKWSFVLHMFASPI